MEYLFPNSAGKVPRIGILQLPQQGGNGNTLEWFVSLNGSQDALYLRRLRNLKNDNDYLAKTTSPDDRPGLFNPEWTSKTDWNNPLFYWRPFIPLAPAIISTPYPLGYVHPIDEFAHVYEIEPGRYQIEESRFLTDLLQRVGCVVDDIRKSNFFIEGSAYPPACDAHLAHHRFRSEADALTASRVIARCILDSLGFIYYHQCIHRHALNELPKPSRDEITSLDLGRFPKRGVVFDLSRDWANMDLRLLLLHDVPVTYLFNESVGTEPRFKRLHPDLLMAFRQAQEAHGLSGPHLSAESIDAWKKELPVLRQFDSYFQRILQPPVQPIPSFNDLPPNATYYVSDFQGWKRRKLPPQTRFYFANLYHFQKFGSDDDSLIFTFWRWLPRIGATETLRTITTLDTIQVPMGEGDLSAEGTMRVRARLANLYAPWCGEVFSFQTGKRLHAGFIGFSRFSQLDITHSITVRDPSVQEEDRRIIADDLTTYPSKEDGQAWLGDDGSNSGGASSCYTLRDFKNTVEPTSSVGDEEDLTREYRRLRAQRSIIFFGGVAFETNNSENHDPKYDIDDYDDYGNDMGEEPPTAWGALKEIGENFTTEDGGWPVPPALQWSPKLIEHGVLVVDDAASMARIRYWAGIQELPTIQAVLSFAIARCIPLTIAIPQGCLAFFKPAALPAIGKMLQETVNQVDQPEAERLHRRLDPLETRTRWLRSVRVLLSEPEARAFIGMGGHLAWIARYLVGEGLVQAFMDGPSYRLSWNNLGTIDEVTMDLTWDRVSEQQVQVLLGVVQDSHPNTSRTETFSIWPTAEVLKESCTSWYGEWNASMEEVFRGLAIEIETAGAVLRNRDDWKTYMTNVENRLDLFHLPHPQQGDAEYLKTRIEAGTGAAWNRMRLRDIVVPGELNV